MVVFGLDRKNKNKKQMKYEIRAYQRIKHNCESNGRVPTGLEKHIRVATTTDVRQIYVM